MYINVLNKFSINEIILRDYKIYAHTKKNSLNKETLEEHIILCKKYFEKIIVDKGIDEIFDNLEKVLLVNCCDCAKEIFRELLVNIINFHDMGKINPIFQRDKMGNNLNLKEVESKSETKHSIFSSIIYIDYHLNKILKADKENKISKAEMKLLITFMTVNSFVISKHHGGLGDINDYLEKYIDADYIYYYEEVINPLYKLKITLNKNKFKGIVKSYKEYIGKELSKNTELGITIYGYVRLMLSLLVASDFYATSEFINGMEINDIGSIDEVDDFYDGYKSGEIYKNIRAYENESYGTIDDFNSVSNINVLRTELFLDAEKMLLKNIDKNIFYLEAPTGSGKSNVANNLAFQLINNDKRKKKIFYVYPFNTLIDQNLKNIEKIYEGREEVLNKIGVINSLFPIKVIKNEEDVSFEEYQNALLNRQFLNYPMVLTTHVSLFRYLFGCGREDIFPFHQLINSVIVLDEIQSYKNKIWSEIIEFLQGFARILNIKIIIMSATLPNLDKLLGSKGNSVNLVENRDKYFKNPLFKNRVSVDYSLFDSTEVMNDIVDKIKYHKNKKILVEFINKKSAYEFYEILKDISTNGELNSEIRLITGDDNQVEREKIINEISSMENVILVATQVIEAGVDIDMDIGFKDISIFDSEEQFLGRINRSCKKANCIVYFFDLDESKRIYKEDVRVQERLTLRNIENREVLREKDFGKYYEKVLSRLIGITTLENQMNTKKFFENEVGTLNCIKVEEKMKLIDDENNDITVFLNSRLMVDGVEIIGEVVWENYKSLLKDMNMDYAEKMVRLSEIKATMNNFMYRVRTKRGFPYEDRIGEILYIENGDDYFINGKLNIKKFTTGVGEFI